MNGRPRIGAMFSPKRSVHELVSVAQHVETLGFEELWVAEDCFSYGGMAAAATALASTERVIVGLGLLPTAVRNAAIAAMEVATLASLHPDRVQVAAGHGVEAWMRQIDARPADRLKALREVVEVTRARLRGEEVSIDGAHVRLDRVALEEPPRSVPPVLIGTAGPRGVAMAGEIADGLLLPEGTGPEAVSWASGMLGAGARTTVYAWLRIDDDADAARTTVFPAVDRWRTRGLYPDLVARSGLPASGTIDASHADRVALVGTPQDCAGSLMRLHAAGADSVVVVPAGEDAPGQLERFAADVAALLPGDA